MNETNGSGNGGRWERADAPLGTLVYRAGLLSKERLESALEEGQQSGRRLGEILLQKGWLEEKDLARLLAGQKGLPFISLRGRGFDPETVRLLPEQVCRYHNAMPVAFDDGTLLVAIADPTDEGAVAEIERELERSFRLVVATGGEIRAALDEVFSLTPAAPSPAVEPAPATPAPLVGETALRVAASPTAAADPETPPVPPAPPPEGPAPSAFPVEAPAPAPAPPPAEAPAPVMEPPAAEPPAPVIERLAPTVSFPPSEPTIQRNEEAHVSVAYHPPTAPPAPPPAPADPAPPASPAAPFVSPAPAVPPPGQEVAARFTLVLNVEGGEEIEVESFGGEADADAAGQELAEQLARAESWPRVGRRFIRPDRILSIEIRESSL